MSVSRRWTSVLTALLTIAAVASPLGAQARTTDGSATLLGVVTDTAAQPLSGVIVQLIPGERRTESGANGRFEIGGLRAGRYVAAVRKLGYAPVHFEIALAAGERAAYRVRLEPVSAQALAPVVVEAERLERRVPKLVQRQRNRLGQMATGAELQRVKHAYDVNGAINNSGTLGKWVPNPAKQCDVYVDAQRVRRPYPGAPLEFWVALDEIEAVEVHRNRFFIQDAVLDPQFSTPPDILRTCVVLIWTKFLHLRPGRQDAGYREDTVAKANRERLAALAAEERARTAADSGAATGSLAGYVLDPTHRPLAGVTLTLIGSRDADGKALRVVTDSTGAFAFERVVPGLVVLRAERRGCDPVLADVVVVAGERSVRTVTMCGQDGPADSASLRPGPRMRSP